VYLQDNIKEFNSLCHVTVILGYLAAVTIYSNVKATYIITMFLCVCVLMFQDFLCLCSADVEYIM